MEIQLCDRRYTSHAFYSSNFMLTLYITLNKVSWHRCHFQHVNKIQAHIIYVNKWTSSEKVNWMKFNERQSWIALSIFCIHFKLHIKIHIISVILRFRRLIWSMILPFPPSLSLSFFLVSTFIFMKCHTFSQSHAFFLFCSRFFWTR